MELILASQSARRKQILAEAGYSFRIIPAYEVTEKTTHTRPSILVKHNAYDKAHAVSLMHPQAVVIGADTIVYQDGRILGKPRSIHDAERMLRNLQGHKHYVYSGVCIMRGATDTVHTFYEKTAVYFKQLTRAEIKKYLSCINACDKAGAYAIQEHGDMIVERVVGSLANVIGFPIERFQEVIRRFHKEGAL